MPELRCDHKMHGVLDGDACTIEVKCSNNLCGAKSGIVVLHTFDLFSGKMIDTKVFRDPIANGGGEMNGTRSVRTPVRSP